MVILQVADGDRLLQLSNGYPGNDANITTVLIGPNGSGKSSLLKRICHVVISAYCDRNEVENPLLENRPGKSSALHYRSNLGSLLVASNKGRMRILVRDEQPTYMAFPSPGNKYISPSKDWGFFPHLNSVKIDYKYDGEGTSGSSFQPKVIAVSSSPFDKFPDVSNVNPFRLQGLENVYVYRGGRLGRRGTKNYMESKFDELGASLINFFLNSKDRKNEILPLFDYLGFGKKFRVTLGFAERGLIRRVLAGDEQDIASSIKSARFFKNKNMLEELPEEVLNNVRRCILNICNSFFPDMDYSRIEYEPIHLEFDLSDPNWIASEYLGDLSILAEFDMIDLKEIEFFKSLTSRPLLLTEASSGELCILFNILSIAGVIADETIVLIDEPELSLHPSWQAGFLPLLETVFQKYKSCHFIVATHSPQIISSLRKINTFVVDLGHNDTPPILGADVSAHSADFQLAKLFGYPGQNNEYLMAEVVDVLSQLRDGREIDYEFREKIVELLKYRDQLDDNDAVCKLLGTLRKAFLVLRAASNE